ncbi:sugar transferase [Weissella cibaria]|nr:sugar transferase [Weissella cibaria]
MKIYSLFIKRALDLVFGILLLIVFALPMIFVAAWITLDSKGPILFKQVRYGRNTVPFVMYKFRTMQVETPEVANQNFRDIDSFVTKSGKILRTASLDELPQIWNVLKGDMSFIGPRPLAKSDMQVIQLRRQNGADSVKPGITGLAQINGRNLVTNNEKAAFDCEYAQKVSLLNDLKILFLTVVKVFKKEGINGE